jgi:hypothetical protein
MNGSDFELKFEDESNYVLLFPRTEEATADEIEIIASRYGFLEPAGIREFDELNRRFDELLNAFDERPLTVGVAESDLAADATTLVSDWGAWIEQFGAESPDADLAQAKQDLISVIAEVSANPTNPGIDEYNSAIGRYNQAVDDYNDER